MPLGALLDQYCVYKEYYGLVKPMINNSIDELIGLDI